MILTTNPIKIQTGFEIARKFKVYEVYFNILGSFIMQQNNR